MGILPGRDGCVNPAGTRGRGGRGGIPLIGVGPQATLMNPTRLKLFLAVLWLVPGLAFLALDAVGGQVHGLPFDGFRLPYAWIFLLFAAFNFARWWAGR